MYYGFRVDIPEEPGKIYRTTIKGVTYINYEYDRVYKPDKKYNILKRTTIGKMCKDDPLKMYPNPSFLKYYPDFELPEDTGSYKRSSCLRIGGWMAARKMVTESLLENIISSVYSGDERGVGLFLDLACYSLITENNAGQYYPDYAWNHPLFTPNEKIYSDSTISTFINEISVDVDKDPRACYFKQVLNGKYMRMALILKLLEEAAK